MARFSLEGGAYAWEASRKSLIPVSGVPLVVSIVKLLKQVFEELIVVTDDPRLAVATGRTMTIADRVTGVGPLGGIHAGLCATSKAAVFFVACDMPFLDPDLIRRQIEYYKQVHCDALVPRVGTLIEPLHAVYNTDLVACLERYFEPPRQPGSRRASRKTYSIRAFLGQVNSSYFDLPDLARYRRAFENLNTPLDFRKVGADPRDAR